MTTPRSLWFESHLFSDRAGRRARDAAERLGAAIHERILANGDRLATLSATIAQQYYKNAAAVWEAAGAADFERWFDLGYGLLTEHQTPRDAAAAYFSLPAKIVTAAGLPKLTEWCLLGSQLARISRKLAGTFFATTTGLVDRLPMTTLRRWVQAGESLHQGAGWRGEFLAQAYFAAAPQALAVLSEDDLPTWARLGAALQPVLREHAYFGSLPAGLASLKPPERQAFFAAAFAAAAINPAAAARVYRELPVAVRRIHGPGRLRVLQALQAAAPAVPAAVADVAAVVGALVHDLPAGQRAAAIELVGRVAERFPRGAVAILRSLPIAYEDARPDAVAAWVERGLAIAAGNPEAGEAYFALESRTSVKILHASPTAVALADVQGLLRKLVQMLSGQPAAIRSCDSLQLRPGLEEQPQENEIELPLRVDVFATHEDNVRIYRFLAAQLAGRREYATYDIRLPEGSIGLHDFLYQQDQPRHLADWFLLADGFRVVTAMDRAYPGLRREHRELAALLVRRWIHEAGRTRPSLFDVLFIWLFSALPLEALPEEWRFIAGLTAASVAPLASPGATANDALRVAELLAIQLAEQTVAAAEVSGSGVLADQMTGDALLAAYLYDEDDPAPQPQGEGQVESDAAGPTPPESPPEDLQLAVNDELDEQAGINAPLSAEALQQLIEAGVELHLKQGRGDEIDGLGLYITDLLGKIPTEQLQELRNLLDESTRGDRPPPRRWLERQSQGTAFYYDEWDYQITDYRRRWCRLLEVSLEGDSGEFFNATLSDYAAMIPEVRRQFQKIRPEMYRIVRGLEDGEDFDLNAVVNARVDRRARRAPSSKVYIARQREERDVATLFLIDMSASTDEPMQKLAPALPEEGDPYRAAFAAGQGPTKPGRRIIDVTKEALVIMAEALEEIGDAYAIYGFSGHGRSNVEFYLVKSFKESLNAGVKGRIGTIEPKRSTRMGTALRHAMEKMAGITARARHLILLSDGFPQDFDYGQDRRSNVYGLRDTSVALRECEAAGITPFCITVDKAGHDYLREMCTESRYLVIDDISSLPRELPKIYQRVVTA